MLLAGSASAHDNNGRRAVSTQNGTATTPGILNPVVGTVTATYRVTDDGNSVNVIGKASGLNPAATYVGLIYPDNTCSTNGYGLTTQNLAVLGEYQVQGNGQRYVFGRYVGAAYNLVKGKIGSVSVRRVDLTFVPGTPGAPAGLPNDLRTQLGLPAGIPGAVTAVLTPVVCVDVK